MFFPEIDEVKETVLWKTRLDEDNFLVDEEGKINEIAGAGYTQTVPVWRCYELPEIILGRDQEFAPAIGAPDYWEQHMELDKTKMRRLYLKTMESLHPGFKLRMEQYKRFIDFAYAVSECQFEHAEVVKDWLDSWGRGIYYNVRDRVLGPWKACTNCGTSGNRHEDTNNGSESGGSLPPLKGDEEDDEDGEDWQDESEGSSVSPQEDQTQANVSESKTEGGYESAREE